LKAKRENLVKLLNIICVLGDLKIEKYEKKKVVKKTHKFIEDFQGSGFGFIGCFIGEWTFG
jgi:hypothetical protein